MENTKKEELKSPENESTLESITGLREFNIGDETTFINERCSNIPSRYFSGGIIIEKELVKCQDILRYFNLGKVDNEKIIYKYQYVYWTATGEGIVWVKPSGGWWKLFSPDSLKKKGPNY